MGNDLWGKEFGDFDEEMERATIGIDPAGTGIFDKLVVDKSKIGVPPSQRWRGNARTGVEAPVADVTADNDFDYSKF